MKGPLKYNDDNDYTLKKKELSCWITVGDISVYVLRTLDGTGVRVTLYTIGDEMDDAIDTAFAPFEPSDDSPPDDS